jgi:NADH-quinone oxidoreductase subunit I
MAQATTRERFIDWLKTMTFYELLVGMKATMSHLIHYKPITLQDPAG